MGGPPRSVSDTRNIVWSEPAANPMTTRPEGRPHETHTGAVRGLEKPKFWGPRFPCDAEFGFRAWLLCDAEFGFRAWLFMRRGIICA